MSNTLEKQEKQLMDYLLVLTNNLKTVHNSLIGEAEANKHNTL